MKRLYHTSIFLFLGFPPSPILPSLNSEDQAFKRIVTFVFTPGFSGESFLLKASTLYADSQNQISRQPLPSNIPYISICYYFTPPDRLTNNLIKMCSKANSCIPSFRYPLLLNKIPSQHMALAKS